MTSEPLPSDPLPSDPPVIETITAEADANPGGDIFGGWVLAQMDLAGGIRAYTYVGGRVVTAGATDIFFKKPIFIAEKLRFYAEIARVGRTSITMKIDVWRAPRDNTAFEKVAGGVYTFVAVDQQNQPLPISHLETPSAA